MRIAHISDFHARHHLPGHPVLLERRSRSMRDLIPRAIDAISNASPDVLVVTGDLVDVPFYGMDDPDVLRLAELDVRLIRDLLEPVGCPVFCLHGNHDHRPSFERVFSDRETDRSVNGYRFVSFYDDEEREHTAERLGAERERFDTVLNDADETPQVHLQHYMIWPERNEGYPHAYREAAELAHLQAESKRVVLSLSGHYHVGEDATQEDGVWYATARAFCQSPHPYRIYELEGNSVRQSEHTVEIEPVGQALIVDLAWETALLSAEVIDALRAIRSRGIHLVGLADAHRIGADGERRLDALSGQLDQADCPLSSNIVRREKETDRRDAYDRAVQHLGIDASASRVVCRDTEEASTAASAGFTAATSGQTDLAAQLGGVT